MADPIKQEGATVVVFNRGNRAYHTSGGWLRPGHSQSLPSAEAKKLLDHRDLVDASTIVPPTNVEKSLRDEVAALKSKVDQLEKEKALRDLEPSKPKDSEQKKSGGK